MALKKEKEKTDDSVGRGVLNTPLIKMERSAEDASGGPLTADVHPDEVKNYEKAGWRECNND